MVLDRFLPANTVARREATRRAEAARAEAARQSEASGNPSPVNPITPDENTRPRIAQPNTRIAGSEFDGFSPELAQQTQQAQDEAIRGRFGDEWRTQTRVEAVDAARLPSLEPTEFQWVPNPLGVYTNTNYRWRFFTVRDTIALAQSVTNIDGTRKSVTTDTLLRAIDSNDGVILFETGSTGFNIKSVEMENFVGADWWNKNAQVTEFKMVVAEPMGIAMADSFFLAAQSLEVKNYLKTPYFLQLDFIGTNEQGEDVVIPGMPAAQAQTTLSSTIPSTWMWRVQIMNIETQLGPGGAIHTLTMRPFAEVGLTEYFLNAKTNITIDGITTIGELLTRLRAAINKQFKDNNDAHEVEFDIARYVPITGQNLPSGNPDPKTWQIVPREFARRNLRSASFVQGEATKLTIGSREGLNEVLQEAVGITKEAQELRKFNRAGGQRVDSIVLWKLQSEVFANTENPYNFVNNTYNYKIRYIIVPYESNQVITDGSRQQIQPPRTQNQETLLLRNRRKKLVKRYDYLFTGLNTEVLDLELNLNTAWMASLPLYNGENSFGQAEAGAAIDNAARAELAGIRARQNALANLQRQIEQLLGRVKANEDVRANDLNEIFNNTPAVISDTVERLRQVTQQGRRFSDFLALRSDSAVLERQLEGFQRSITQVIDQNQRRLRDQALQRRLGDEINADIRRRANDIRSRAGNGNLNYVELLNEVLEGRFDRQLPVSLRPDNFENRAEVDRSTELGGNLEEGRNRLVYATILNQAKTTQDFLKIDISIKGDPYWLGNNHYGAPRITIEPHTMNADLADAMFLLTFKLPSGIDANGNVRLNNADVYNGVYIALSVKSFFENGKFSQTITAMRDVLVQIPPDFNIGPINYI